MADKDVVSSERGAVDRMMNAARLFLKRSKDINRSPQELISASLFDGGTTIATMLGAPDRPARTRHQIYQKWMDMMSDPIVSSAVKLLVTSSLGGHETTGDVIFIEEKKLKSGKVNAKHAALIDDLRLHLQPLLNKNAFTVAFNSASFGDGYSRIYAKKGAGVLDISSDELLNPLLIQPYEQGSRTVGYVAITGNKQQERLTTMQVARAKMPRTQWVPQMAIVEKAYRVLLAEDDLDSLPMLPALAGGSLIYNAEDAYDKLYSALTGLLGQRVLDSIDEQIMTVQMAGMNADQQARFVKSIVSMLKKSKERAEEAVASKKPFLERIRHIIPVFGEKQVTGLQQFPTRASSGSGSNYTIEDVMLYARLLSGAIGLDLSLLGFADQLSGGLGDGGFFRTSAQAAENARIIRSAMNGWVNHIIDVHTYHKYGFVFEEAERPFNVKYWGSISALEAEKKRSRADDANAGLLLAQVIDQMKNMGATKDQLEYFLVKQMGVDEDLAKNLASIVDAKSRMDAGGDPGAFGDRIAAQVALANEAPEGLLSGNALNGLSGASRSPGGREDKKVDFYTTPNKLMGGITPERARKLHDQQMAMTYAKENLFLLQVVEHRTSREENAWKNAGQLFNMFAIDLSYSPSTISGNPIKIGGATIDGVSSSEPVDLRVTTYDDERGSLKQWFEAKANQVVRSDGTHGLPVDYLVRINIVHQFVDPQAPIPDWVYHGEYLMRPVNMDVELNRSGHDLAKLTMSFHQHDTFRAVR
jgi:hypothetical protein